MIEEIHIDEPGGPIEILGKGTDSALLLEGVLIQFTFLREIGSTWRYQIAKSLKESDIIKDRSFANTLKYGYGFDEHSLKERFRYFLNFLCPGTYRLELVHVSQDTELREIWEDTGAYNQQDEYGGISGIIATQSYFEETCIQEYENLIEKGHEPIMILLRTDKSGDNYLMDGHHKCIAYGRQKKKACALQITRLDDARIDKERGLELLQKHVELKARYLRMYKK